MVKVQFKVSSANNLWYLCHMAKYKNRTVKLNKPSRGDVKKFKVFVKVWLIDFLIKCLKHLIGYLINLFQMHQDVNVKERKINNLWVLLWQIG